MGSFFSKLWRKLTGIKEVSMMMVGLDGAGKTTIFYQLKDRENLKTIPTIGFNVESLKYKGLNFTVWDIGGQLNHRVVWKHYYKDKDGIIYVVDSYDKERIENSAEELNHMLEEEVLKNCPLLVLANKQDLNEAMSPKEVAGKLGLDEIKDRKWVVQGTDALTGQGIREGLDWMAEVLLKKR